MGFLQRKLNSAGGGSVLSERKDREALRKEEKCDREKPRKPPQLVVLVCLGGVRICLGLRVCLDGMGSQGTK